MTNEYFPSADKMMLISCLQFLVNFIQKNDKRKFVLWLDLFANSRTSDENLEATLDPRKDEPVAAVVPGKSDLSLNAKVKALSEEIRTMRPEAVIGNDPATLVGQGMEVISDKESVTTSETNKNVPPDGVGQIASRDLSLPDRSVYEALEEGEKPQLDEDLARTLEGLQIMHEASSSREPYADVYAQSDDHPYSWSNLPNQTVLRASSMKLDEMTVRTPESAAEILQQAKDQLMARLEQHPEGQELNGQAGSAASENDDEGDVRASDVAANGSVSGENNDDESTLRNVSDQERGLLTDLPLVLSPKEIEALPMILQAGIVGDLRQGELPEGRDAPDMDSVRCKILLAQESGRNLLREMLIFIAAWDLQDNELYFQLMTQIMEAILENGLMPFAYQAFGEEKDIVSPAQSMVIKILTQIFRNPKHLRPAVRGSGSTVAGQRREITARVDTLIVRNIFTTFRQCIIPETCALIYLQGQIRANIAAPEDFPFNSWDMERVYEGVYQFLEFFAVLTESEEWKGLLVQWEIVSELVTLLRELDASIPKAPLGQGPLPQTAAAGASIIIGANAKSQAMLQQSFPTPVAVERPYDQAPSDQAWPRTDTADGTTSESASVPLETLDACEFEWRNLKKLVVLVLSSLVWHSPKVQDQIRHYGGVEMMLGCCNYDAHNPYIREHAIMCLRFLLEDNQKNMDIVRELSPRMAVPDEVLDKRGYETYIDSHGKVGLRAKDTSIKIIAEPRVLAL